MLDNIGDLTKPLDTLINRSADGITGWLKPWQMKRIAKTEIEIAKEQARAAIDLPKIVAEPLMVQIGETMQQQANLHNIAYEAEQALQEDVTITPPDQDFMDHYISKSKIVSDEHMQQLWGRLLAGEMQHHGRFSKRTMEFVSTLSVKDAEDIQKLFNGLIWSDGEPQLAVGPSDHTELLSGCEAVLDKNSMYRMAELLIFNHDLTFSKTPTVDWFKVLQGKNISFGLQNYFRDKEVYMTIKDSVEELKSPLEITITTSPLTNLGIELAYLANPNPSQHIQKITGEVVLKRLVSSHSKYLSFEWRDL